MDLLLCCDEQIPWNALLLPPPPSHLLPFTNYAINAPNCSPISPYIAPNYDPPPIDCALNLPINAPSPTDHLTRSRMCPFICPDSCTPCTDCSIHDGLSMPVTETEVRELMQKQRDYMPDDHYLEGLQTHNLIQARSKSIRWMLEIQSVFNFSATTIALAINYFDRYLSKNLSKVQSTWMFELLAIACLTASIKMEETSVPELTSIQVGALEHNFDTKTITRMELLLLQTLQWKLKSITTHSFVEVVLYELKICEGLRQMLFTRISNLIFGAMSEGLVLWFPPSVLAACGIFQVLEECAPSLLSDVISSTRMSRIILYPDGAFFLHCCKLMGRIAVKETLPLSMNNDTCPSSESVLCDFINPSMWIGNVPNLIPLNLWKSKTLEGGYMCITTFSNESRKRKRNSLNKSWNETNGKRQE